MVTVIQLTLTVIIPCLLIGFRVTGSHDRTIRIWSTATWECEGVLEGHEGENVTNMAENVAFRFFFFSIAWPVSCRRASLSCALIHLLTSFDLKIEQQ